jgi:hypothetical protein
MFAIESPSTPERMMTIRIEASPDRIGVDSTPPITLRWEWRVFEPFPGAFIDRVCPRHLDDVESVETYILSAASPHNVKIRHSQLDVKLLEDTRAGDLELWRPVFNHGFPLEAHDLAPVWTAWALPEPILRRVSYTIEQFLNEIVASTPVLRAVTIAKRRARFSIAGVQAERAGLTIGGERWETLAIEDEHPEHILLAQRTFDSAVPRGTNYPAMLKRIAGTDATSTSSMRPFI